MTVRKTLGIAAAAVALAVVVALLRYTPELGLVYVANYPVNYALTGVAWWAARRNDAVFWTAFYAGLVIVAVDCVLPLALLGSLPFSAVLGITLANAAANWLVIPARAALLFHHYGYWPILRDVWRRQVALAR